VLSSSAPFSHASDVFSAAVVLWEVFERQRPYEREFRHVSDIAGAVVGGFRLPLTAATPPAVAALITRCWAAEAARRPNFAEMLATLQACMARCEEEKARASAAAAAAEGGRTSFGSFRRTVSENFSGSFGTSADRGGFGSSKSSSGSRGSGARSGTCPAEEGDGAAYIALGPGS
jgi:hypothetical protein